MTIERSDVACPECGHRLQVIYISERKQVVSGWACSDCGFVASEKQGFQDTVELSRDKEYVVRVEKPLTTDDIRREFSDVNEEFRARAAETIADEEVWMLIDPDDDSLVDIVTAEDDTEE
jgi:rubredoxin